MVSTHRAPQHTYETCLAWSLLTILGEEPTFDRELEVLEHSLRFSKEDFTSGHLDAIAAHCKEVTLFIDEAFAYDVATATRLRNASNIAVQARDVLKMLNEKNLTSLPAILYLDAFALYGAYHYPHFVILEQLDDTNATILDPWDGREKQLTRQELIKAVRLLKEHMQMAPRIILLQRR